MSDTDDARGPTDVTKIENLDVASTANRRINNDREVDNDDADYREITERRENEERGNTEIDDAADVLLRLRAPREGKSFKTKIKKSIKKAPPTIRPMMRGKTKKKGKRKKGKSHKKKKISRDGKKN